MKRFKKFIFGLFFVDGKFKTFNDLAFKAKSNGIDGEQALIDFKNGYGVSVISGYGAYSDIDHPYELAVFRGGDLCYSTPLTDDVLGHLTATDVTNHMKDVQLLPRVK